MMETYIGIIGLIISLCSYGINCTLKELIKEQKTTNEFLNSIESDLIDVATEIRTKG